MTLIVETGAGVPNANSYAGATAATNYAQDAGLAWPSDTPTQERSLRRATAWLDATYRAQYPGYRLNRRLQGLEWPRSMAYLPIQGGAGPSPSFYGSSYTLSAFDYDEFSAVNQFDYLPSNVVPTEIVNATIEAAVREAAQPGLLMGDVTVQGQIRKETAGDTSFDYFPVSGQIPSSSGGIRFPAIDAILATLLIERSGLTARAARG